MVVGYHHFRKHPFSNHWRVQIYIGTSLVVFFVCLVVENDDELYFIAMYIVWKLKYIEILDYWNVRFMGEESSNYDE